MAKFREEFRKLSDDLEHIARRLVQRQEEQRAELSLEAMRRLHTLKGNAFLMGLTAMGELVHAVEGQLASSANGEGMGRREGQALLWVLDELRALLETPGAPLSDQIHRLEEMLTERAVRVPRQTLNSAAVLPNVTSVRTPVAELEELLELAERARAEVTHGGSLDGAVAALGALASRLVRLRKARLSDWTPRFQRLVEDHALATGKKVDFELHGDHLEVEVGLLEDLAVIVPHLLRNALDHGIEAPHERLEADKPERGMLILALYDTGDAIEVVVSDDGRGISTDKVVERALKHGIASRGEVDAMTHYERLGLVLMPGFSTRDEVNRTSGRGVGLDVVSAIAERRRGQLEIDTEEGEFTRFEVRFPNPSHSDDLLLVRLGGRLLGVPVRHVSEIVPATDAPTSELGLLQWQGALLPVVGVEALDPLFGEERRRPWLVLDAQGRGAGLAMAVDALVGFERILLRSWPSDMRRPYLTGLGRSRSGDVVWGLDATTVIRRWNSYTVPEDDGAGGDVAPSGDGMTWESAPAR